MTSGPGGVQNRQPSRPARGGPDAHPPRTPLARPRPKPAPRRRERRQRGSRLWRRLGLGLVIALPLLYFAFTKVFFDPFEGEQPMFAELVPRDVQVYARRERLDSDLDGLRPVLWDRLRATPAFRTVEQTAWWQGLQWPRDLDALLGVLEQSASGAPLDPVADLLGREVALVGRLSDTPGMPHVAALLRLSGRAKLAVELLDFDAGLQKALPGAVLSEVDDPDDPGQSWRRLELPAEVAPGAAGTWFYARRLDLLVVSRDETLVRDVLRQVDAGADSSLGLSRLYHEELPPASGAPDARLSLEFLLDPQPLITQWLGEEPEGRSPDALDNALRRLVDPRLVGETVGRLELDERVVLRLSADLDDAAAGAPTAGLAGAPSFGVRERLGDVLALLPSDVSAVVTLNAELRPLLETILEALGPDETKLLNDTLRDMSRYSPAFKVDSLPALVAFLDRTLGDEVTLALRPLDHEVPPGSQPVPTLAFLFRVQDAAAWAALDGAVVSGYKALGLDPSRMKQLDEGVGVRKWLGVSGLPMEEFSYVLLDGELAVVATDADLVREIVSVYTSQRSSAATKAETRALLDAIGPQARANLAGWGDVEALLRILQPYGPWLADAATLLDLGVVRLEQGRELLATPDFRKWQAAEADMPKDVRQRFEADLDARVQAVERRRVEDEVPRLAAAWWDARQWLRLFRRAAFGLRLGEHDAELVLAVDSAAAR